MVIAVLFIYMEKLPESEKEWREKLSDEEYRILREAGTEPRFSGDYLDLKDEGVFKCAGCDAELFDTSHKFESGTGWPSFYDVVDSQHIETKVDKSHGMERIEVTCGTCDGHLGHVFEDGPDPTGKRYCINSGALEFEEE